MATVNLGLEEIKGSTSSALPTIEFDFRVREINPSDGGRGAALVDMTIIPTIASGSHVGLDLPPLDVSIPQDSDRIERVDRFDASLSVPTAALERIEEMRREFEGDLKLSLRFDLVFQKDDGEIIRDKANDDIRIAEYQWRSVLDDLGFHDRRVMELEFTGDVASKAALENAFADIQQAQRRNNERDYKGAIKQCREAVEDLEHVDEELLTSAFDAKKLDAAETQLETFRKQFLGKFSHSEKKIDIEPALPRDSDFALTITKAFVSYYAKAIEDSESPR